MRGIRAAAPPLILLVATALLAGCAATPTPVVAPAPASVPATTAALPGPTAAAAAPAPPSPEPTIHLVTIAPSPTAIAYGPFSVVTGTEVCSVTSGASRTDPDGTEHMRGGRVECTDYTNDPRVSGTYTGPYNLDWWGLPDHATGALVQWGTMRLVNAGGAWEGRLAGVFSMEQRDIITVWWKGTGGYAGLSYFDVTTGNAPWALRGQISPGEPPNPTGAPPVAAATPKPPPAFSPSEAPAAGVTPLGTLAPLPAATPTTYGPVTVVAGALYCSSIGFGTMTTDATGVTHGRDGRMDCLSTTDDPRTSGTYTGTWDFDRWGASDGSDTATVRWGTTRIENAGGAWVGHVTGVYSTDGADTLVTWFTGTGGYAGLTYFEMLRGVGPWQIQGQVFPGSPPTP
jgi:hypothetical protein